MKKDNRFEQVAQEANEEIKKAKHYVAFILDRSSSMESIRVEAVDAFNKQVEQTKQALEGKDNIEVEVSLVTFSTRMDEPEIWCKPLNQVKPITVDDFVPRGWTALYDAIGGTVTKLQEQSDINDDMTSVLIIIVTDGAENYSQHFSDNNISTMIQEMQATDRWTFVYEGANIDLASVQDATKLNKNNMLSFDGDSVGIANVTFQRRDASQVYYGNLTREVNQANTEAKGLRRMSSSNFYSTEDGSSGEKD